MFLSSSTRASFLPTICSVCFPIVFHIDRMRYLFNLPGLGVTPGIVLPLTSRPPKISLFLTCALCAVHRGKKRLFQLYVKAQDIISEQLPIFDEVFAHCFKTINMGLRVGLTRQCVSDSHVVCVPSLS